MNFNKPTVEIIELDATEDVLTGSGCEWNPSKCVDDAGGAQRCTGTGSSQGDKCTSMMV